MSHRIVDEGSLAWAVTAACPPNFESKRRRPGVKGMGQKYEADVAHAVEKAGLRCKAGQWFRFKDRNGVGFCQTDVLFECPQGIVVLECKLTDVAQARTQLLYLYRPILAKLFARPILCIAVTRHLSRETALTSVVDSLVKAVAHPGALANLPPTLHWIGRGPI